MPSRVSVATKSRVAREAELPDPTRARRRRSAAGQLRQIGVRLLHEQGSAGGRAAAADSRRFDEGDANAGVGEAPRERGAGDAAADDRDVHRRARGSSVGKRRWRATESRPSQSGVLTRSRGMSAHPSWRLDCYGSRRDHQIVCRHPALLARLGAAAEIPEARPQRGCRRRDRRRRHHGPDRRLSADARRPARRACSSASAARRSTPATPRAHLTMVTDERLSALVKRFGRDHAQAAWDAGLAAIAQIDSIVADLELACDFAWVPGYLHAPMRIRPPTSPRVAPRGSVARVGARLRRVVRRARCRSCGGPGIRYRRPGAVPSAQVSRRPRARDRRSRRDDLRALGAPTRSATIRDRSRANGHTLACDDIVLATHTPLMGNTGLLSATLFQTKLSLYTSYAVSGRVEKGRVPDALFWDTADPYHYLRIEPHRDHDVVIFGGEDHKTGQAADTGGVLRRGSSGRWRRVLPARSRSRIAGPDRSSRRRRPAVHRRDRGASVRRRPATPATA